MQELKAILDSVLKNAGIDKAVLQNKSLILWDEVVGDKIAEHTSAQDVKHGTLRVRVATPVWRNELALRKKEILKKLNNRLGKKVIKDIKWV